MATTKIWPVRDNLARVLDYAENHLKTANPSAYTAKELKVLHEVLDYAANSEKTAKQFYVSGVNCIGEIAYRQMSATKHRFGKTDGNLAYHAYQSFAPDEITPEQCHQIGMELAKQLWGDRYEVLVSTHLNTHCVHNHFVINSVSFVDGLKLDNNYGMYFKNLRAGSDGICREYGLSVIEEPGRSGGNKWMQQAEKRGEPTLYNVVKSDIDNAIRQSMTDRQFYQKMREWGYTFDFNPNRKYPTLRAPGQKHNVRFKTLGEKLNSATAALRAEDKEIDARIKEHEKDINEIKRTYATKGEMNDIEKSFQNENRMTCEKTETNRKDIQYIQQNYATKNDLKDIKTELRDDYKKLVVDVAEIKDNYIRKDDFYRTISDLSRTVDKVYELLIKEKGGVGIGKQG